MKVVRVVSGRGLPLKRNDVDTDQIIPAEWLKRVERTGFEKGLFSTWRDDRNFVLNDEKYLGASILIAGKSFGIGSSREHAVWAIQQGGFDAVIAPSFSDIFRNNCGKNGLVVVPLAENIINKLWQIVEDDPAAEITIDVERLVVELAGYGIVETFEMSSDTQNRFLNGLDDIAISLGHREKIATFELARPAWLSPQGRIQN